MESVLEKEREYYAQIKDGLLRNHYGKFVLIHADQMIGIWDSQESAYIKGVEILGLEPFLIQPIIEEDEPEEVPALFVGCS